MLRFFVSVYMLFFNSFSFTELLVGMIFYLIILGYMYEFCFVISEVMKFLSPYNVIMANLTCLQYISSIVLFGESLYEFIFYKSHINNWSSRFRWLFKEKVDKKSIK